MDIEALIVKLQARQSEVKELMVKTNCSGTLSESRFKGELHGLQLAIDEATKESDQLLRIRFKKSLAEYRKKEKAMKRPRCFPDTKVFYQGIINAYQTAVQETIRLEKEDV